MTIDNNEAFDFLCGLAERKATAETRYYTLLSLNGVKDNPAIDDKIEDAKDAMRKADDLFKQFKCMCNLQPSEKEEINTILAEKDDSIIANAYRDYISTID